MEVEMCTHYWEIDSVDKGVCKNCGKKKNFRELQNRDYKRILREGVTLDRIFPTKKLVGVPSGMVFVDELYSYD